MREQVLVRKQRLHSDTERLLSPFVRHTLSSLAVATTHVPNHSFLVQLRADWLRAVHTPDTPPMKCLLRFLALAPGFSAQAIRGLHLYPMSVNPYTHKINIQTHSRWSTLAVIRAGLSCQEGLAMFKHFSHTSALCFFFNSLNGFLICSPWNTSSCGLWLNAVQLQKLAKKIGFMGSETEVA